MLFHPTFENATVFTIPAVAAVVRCWLTGIAS